MPSKFRYHRYLGSRIFRFAVSLVHIFRKFFAAQVHLTVAAMVFSSVARHRRPNGAGAHESLARGGVRANKQHSGGDGGTGGGGGDDDDDDDESSVLEPCCLLLANLGAPPATPNATVSANVLLAPEHDESSLFRLR